ncbi:uncharacterized protein LOC126836857 [Adelges cooleyi]|uniref:uncharacterized protein LOC126836857 n=1 Tax=Adelges cooleyi TaxID=133065 RepID=UPI00217F7199|nr:uncharacterized protein LOC126836857 [Adelges cooleyi]
MYLKITLLICALHFFAAVWSVGLMEVHINKIDEFFDKYRGRLNEVPKNIIIHFLLNEMLYNKLTKVYTSEDAVIDDKTVPNFLLKMGLIDKDIDDPQERGMTTYEIKLYVKMFNVHDKKSVEGEAEGKGEGDSEAEGKGEGDSEAEGKGEGDIEDDGEGEPDGVLTHAEFSDLLDAVLNLEADVKLKIKNKLKNNNAINVAKFLATLMEHRTRGKGLDKRHIEKAITLYECYYANLNRGKQQELYENLNIVSDEYKDLIDFEHPQSIGYELQEFLIFWAENNNEVEGVAIPSKDVRDIVYEFTRYDTGNDGVVSFEEFEPIFRSYFNENEDIRGVFKKYTNNNADMTAAMFMNIKYDKIFLRNKNNEDVTMEETNDTAK